MLQLILLWGAPQRCMICLICSLLTCCKQASLDRLDQKSVDLYQIHWPGFPILNSWANDAFCRGLVDCQKQGLAKAVGVSNYNVNRLQRAHGVMKVSLFHLLDLICVVLLQC